MIRDTWGNFGRRGISEVLGALLVFALIILLIGVIQATLVPENVADREFEHSKQVEGDLNRLAATVREVRSTGSQQAVGVSVSPRYGSTSAFLIYPSEPRGALRTSSANELRLGNIEAIDDEARDYWDFDSTNPVVYDTRTLRYEVDYNRFRGAPTYTYNQGILAKQFESDTVIAAGKSPIQGRRILLTLLKGDTSVNSEGVRSVDINPGSTGTTLTPVQAKGSGPLELTLPTDLEQDKWCDILSSEIQQGSTAASTCGVTGTTEGNIVVLSVSSGELSLELRNSDGGDKITYLIDLSTVSIDERPSDVGPQYIVVSENTDRQIATGTDGTLSARVLDEYGNPVSGVTVEFLTKGPSDSSFNPYQTITTNENGYARVSFSPSAVGTYEIKARFGTSSDDQEAIYTVNALDPSSGGDSGLLDNGESSGVKLVDATLNGNSIDVEFENIGSSTRTIEEVQVSFYYKANANNPPSQINTGFNDGNSPTLDVGGDFETVNENIDPGPSNSEVYSFVPVGTSPQSGDFMIVNIIYDSEQSDTYIAIAQN